MRFQVGRHLLMTVHISVNWQFPFLPTFGSLAHHVPWHRWLNEEPIFGALATISDVERILPKGGSSASRKPSDPGAESGTMNPRRRPTSISCALACALLRCASRNPDIGGFGDSGGGVGATQPGECSPYCTAPAPPAPTSTIRAVGFDAWEGQIVQGCFTPSQNICPRGCADAVVVGGRFELTASACTAFGWYIDIDHALTCDGVSGTITPSNCTCYAGSGVGGSNCDAGVDVVEDALSDGPEDAAFDAEAVDAGRGMPDAK